MEKKGEWEVDERKVGLAGGPTAVNRDGSSGQTSRVPETPTYFPLKIYSPSQQNKPLIRDSARIHLYAKWKRSLQDKTRQIYIYIRSIYTSSKYFGVVEGVIAASSSCSTRINESNQISLGGPCEIYDADADRHYRGNRQLDWNRCELKLTQKFAGIFWDLKTRTAKLFLESS